MTKIKYLKANNLNHEGHEDKDSNLFLTATEAEILKSKNSLPSHQTFFCNFLSSLVLLCALSVSAVQ
jgi:hypothetical protein